MPSIKGKKAPPFPPLKKKEKKMKKKIWHLRTVSIPESNSWIAPEIAIRPRNPTHKWRSNVKTKLNFLLLNTLPKTQFEASGAVFWSLSGRKKTKLPKRLLNSRIWQLVLLLGNCGHQIEEHKKMYQNIWMPGTGYNRYLYINALIFLRAWNVFPCHQW